VLRYIVGRVAQGVLVLLVVSMFSYSLIELAPGDPVSARVGAELVDKEFIATLRKEYRLDDPMPVRYLAWLRHAVEGDLGFSTKTRMSVTHEIATRLPATLHVGIGALAIGVLLGISAGSVSAMRPGSLVDRAIILVAVAGVSIPDFFLGIVAILVFSVHFGWLPSSGYVPIWQSPVASVQRLILPCAILGLSVAGILARHTRSAMLEVLAQDYIRTARAKGLGETRVMLAHALRNAALPVVTVLSLIVGRVFAGSVVIETVFSIPGLGRYLVSGVQNSDYPVVQAIILLSAIAIVAVNLFADLAYGLLDPRIKVGGGG
jgi:peptide/nickel transport system permease protein